MASAKKSSGLASLVAVSTVGILAVGFAVWVVASNMGDRESIETALEDWQEEDDATKGRDGR